MDELGEEPSARPTRRPLFSVEYRVGEGRARWRPRPGRWACLAAFAAFGYALTWGLDHEVARWVVGAGPGAAAERRAPAANAPPASQAARNNNRLMALGWVADLDGTAVIYPREVNGLVAADGRFRTDLSPAEMARILGVDPATIARPGSSDEIDARAVLFRAVSGELTGRARALARRWRGEQADQGRIADAVGYEWVPREFAFTLGDLEHPDDAERRVLVAISRAARQLMPEPGEGIRAIAVERSDVQPHNLAPGYLPPAKVSDAAIHPLP